MVTPFAEKGENSDQLNQNIVMGGGGGGQSVVFVYLLLSSLDDSNV